MAGNLSLPEALGADPPDGGWTIDLPDSPAGESPWLMLLGENGCGKSSVLQAVALTLMGKAYREKLEIDAREFLRRLPGSSGETVGEGVVRVFLTGQREPCELRFSKDSRFFQGSEDPKVLLLAYGATRLLPKNPHRPAEGESFARVENLFDPFVPLQDATAWLLDLHRGQPEVFQEMAAALLDLLGLDAVVELRPVPEKEMILVEIHGTSIPLEKLSDGYQSVLAVTTDIMAVMLDKWSSMVIAEGVVLLDEIGAHLHPRWRMRVVTSLRRAFPKVQFLVSTHDPLCLRGLEDGEVVLMRRDAEQGIHAVRDLPPIKGLTVNQLLTSEHFGLASTLDPALEASFERYSALLADSQRSEEEDRELDTLRRLLGRYDLLGQTRRERLMLEAIDRHLALEPKMLGHVPAEEWDRRLQEELEAILSGVG